MRYARDASAPAARAARAAAGRGVAAPRGPACARAHARPGCARPAILYHLDAHTGGARGRSGRSWINTVTAMAPRLGAAHHNTRNPLARVPHTRIGNTSRCARRSQRAPRGRSKLAARTASNSLERRHARSLTGRPAAPRPQAPARGPPRTSPSTCRPPGRARGCGGRARRRRLRLYVNDRLRFSAPRHGLHTSTPPFLCYIAIRHP